MTTPNDPHMPRCDDCVDRVHPKSGCLACEALRRSGNLDQELQDLTADERFVRTTADGVEPADEQDFAARVFLLARGILSARVPEAAARAVFELRKDTGSPRYVRLIAQAAFDQVALQLLEGAPIDKVPALLVNLQAATMAYRSVRPLGEPVRVVLAGRGDRHV